METFSYILMDIGAWLIALGLFLGGVVLILWVGLKLFEVFNGVK